MGESGSLFLKNGLEWVAYLEKWVGAGWSCQKMGGSGSLFLKNGWEWVRVAGSGYEWARVTGCAIR